VCADGVAGAVLSAVAGAFYDDRSNGFILFASLFIPSCLLIGTRLIDNEMLHHENSEYSPEGDPSPPPPPSHPLSCYLHHWLCNYSLLINYFNGFNADV
jgi:hypothetical protein